MKLIAIQRISEQLQAGASFEIPDHDLPSAHTLIEAGLAREDTGETTHREAPSNATDQTEPPVTPGRRAYRRRDLNPEP